MDKEVIKNIKCTKKKQFSPPVKIDFLIVTSGTMHQLIWRLHFAPVQAMFFMCALVFNAEYLSMQV